MWPFPMGWSSFGPPMPPMPPMPPDPLFYEFAHHAPPFPYHQGPGYSYSVTYHADDGPHHPPRPRYPGNTRGRTRCEPRQRHYCSECRVDLADVNERLCGPCARSTNPFSPARNTDHDSAARNPDHDPALQASQTWPEHFPKPRTHHKFGKCYGCKLSFGSDGAVMNHVASGTCDSRMDRGRLQRIAMEFFGPCSGVVGAGRLDPTFRCPLCQEIFSSVAQLVQHAEDSRKCDMSLEGGGLLDRFLDDLQRKMFKERSSAWQ